MEKHIEKQIENDMETRGRYGYVGFVANFGWWLVFRNPSALPDEDKDND